MMPRDISGEMDASGLEAKRLELLNEEATYLQVQETFSTDGWSHVSATLEAQRLAAIKRLTSVDVDSMEKVAQLRAEIRALERLIKLPEEMGTRLGEVRAQLEELKEMADA